MIEMAAQSSALLYILDSLGNDGVVMKDLSGEDIAEKVGYLASV